MGSAAPPRPQTATSVSAAEIAAVQTIVFFMRRIRPGDQDITPRPLAVLPATPCVTPNSTDTISCDMQLRVLGIVLAGGKGTRLYPLTKERAKPAVPFGGKYRIVDFVLSNLINSGIYSIYVLTQFRSQSLLQHLSEGWQFGGLLKNQFIIPVPAQMRSADETWYQGTADAIFQNINLIEQADPHLVAIFGADHIYRMNIASMIEYHQQKSAQVTVAAIPVEKRLAAEFGVIETRGDGRIVRFHEKKADAPTIPGDPDHVYASMGNYIFSTRTLLRELQDDAANDASSHDFGRDILPSLVGRSEVYAYNFQSNRIPGESRATRRPTGATSERSTRTTKPTWTCARFRRRSISTIASGRCAPPASPIRPRNSPSMTRTGAGRPSIRSSPAARFFPAAWCAIR